MLRNDGVKEGFKRQKEYDRPSRPGIRWQHVNDAAGRVYLIIGQLAAEEMLQNASAPLMTRDFRGSGVNKLRLHARVQYMCPEYGSYYEKMTGNKFTPDITYHRCHKKSWYKNGKPGHGGTPSQSAEHYTSSKKLRPLVPAVEKAFRNGKPLSLVDMKRLGEIS